MLSAVELEYLKSPERFNANYSRLLKHRIRGKVKALSSELSILKHAGFLGVTESHNSRQTRKTGVDTRS
jgi:hypothetical protein